MCPVEKKGNFQNSELKQSLTNARGANFGLGQRLTEPEEAALALLGIGQHAEIDFEIGDAAALKRRCDACLRLLNRRFIDCSLGPVGRAEPGRSGRR